jgi:tetratricopeptide (TPR) repeat protein
MPARHNLGYHIDDDLREVPDAPDDMRAAVTAWIAVYQANRDDRERLNLAGQIGTYARMLRDLDTAAEYLAQAVKLADSLGDARAHVINRIRLAHVYQWHGDYPLSTSMFTAIVTQVMTEPALFDLRDFAYQHAGKNYYDQERYADAILCFAHALVLRQQKGDAELIASSEQALDAASARARALRAAAFPAGETQEVEQPED